jgi:hypothetical protein
MVFRSKKSGEIAMVRKIMIIIVMGPLILGAASAGTSVPVLLLMSALLLIALFESSVRTEEKD